MPFHQFLDAEWMFALLGPVHSPIMMRGCPEMADRTGKVTRLAFWSLRGSFARRSGRRRRGSCALSEGVVEP